MTRHYRPATRAERDARIDARVAAMQAAGVPLRDFRPRDPAVIELHVDGQHFVAHGAPARRCNQFSWTLNGEPIGIGGAEVAWREIQKRRAPLMARRHCL